MGKTKKKVRKPASAPESLAGLPPKPKSRSKVDEALWEEILLWYVQHGLQHVKASKEFGLSRRTLTGLYYSGAPHLNKPAMKHLVNTVEVRARALRQSMREEELQKAEEEIQRIINGTSTATLARSVDDAARARAEEGAVVQAGRRNILNLQSMLSPLLRGAATRLRQLERDVSEMAPSDVLKTLRDLAKLQTDLTSAAKTNMEMERLLMGSGSDHDDEERARLSMDEKAAVRVLELSAKTLNRMRERGRLVDGEGEEVARVTVDPLADEDEEDDDEPQVGVH